MCSRGLRRRCIHSIWSANTLGVAFSTVLGRLMITSRPGPAPQAAMAVWQALSETSSSVALKVSGEYCRVQRVSGRASVRRFRSDTCSCTKAITCVTFMPDTTRRQTRAVAL